MGIPADGDELARIQAATDYPLQRSEDGWIAGYFFNCRLSSVFQPVFDTGRRRIVGQAAYIRSEAVGEVALSPWGVFSLAAQDPVLVRLDRLCRTVHALNYFGRAGGQGSLFVGVQSRLLESVRDGHGRAFERVLDLIGVETSRVVIDIPAEVNRDWRLLRHVIANYRSRGYRIAVNHGGANDDRMAELGSLYPDIVRLEAPALARRNAIASLPDAVHRFGAMLMVQDIETMQQMSAAVDAGADLLQGRFLGGPLRSIEASSSAAAAGQPPEHALQTRIAVRTRQ